MLRRASHRVRGRATPRARVGVTIPSAPRRSSQEGCSRGSHLVRPSCSHRTTAVDQARRREETRATRVMGARRIRVTHATWQAAPAGAGDHAGGAQPCGADETSTRDQGEDPAASAALRLDGCVRRSISRAEDRRACGFGATPHSTARRVQRVDDALGARGRRHHALAGSPAISSIVRAVCEEGVRRRGGEERVSCKDSRAE